jgi:hypothetical protein
MGEGGVGRGMRYLLMACGLMNLGGVATFAPPFPLLRNQVGLPEAHPLYLWVLTAWLPLFGVAYFWMGWTGRMDRTFLAVGAAGKATFALILLALWGERRTAGDRRTGRAAGPGARRRVRRVAMAMRGRRATGVATSAGCPPARTRCAARPPGPSSSRTTCPRATWNWPGARAGRSAGTGSCPASAVLRPEVAVVDRIGWHGGPRHSGSRYPQLADCRPFRLARMCWRKA